MLGDLNGRVGDRVRVCTTGAFGNPGENDNGLLGDFCVERGLFVGNTYFDHRVYISTIEWLGVKMELM